MMLYEITSKDMKTEIYSIREALTGSSRPEETEISEELDRLFSFLVHRGLPKEVFLNRSLSPVFKIDVSSIYPVFEPRNETCLTKELSEEEMIGEMEKRKSIVHKYIGQLRIKSVRWGIEPIKVSLSPLKTMQKYLRHTILGTLELEEMKYRSAQKMLTSFEQKVYEGQPLSFEDIPKIKKIVDLFGARHSYSTLDMISQILDKDIEARKKRGARDPIAVLNDYFNIAIGIYHKRYFGEVKEKASDKAGTVTQRIYEKIRAVIFNEFDRLSDVTEQKLLSGEIRREGYLQEINRYYKLACSYWPK